MHTDVCVIGNGAIGKTAALGFAQAGRRVTLLGATSGGTSDNTQWDQRVYAINPAARSLLGRLKVWDALDAARIAVVDAMVVKGDGNRAGELGFDAYGAHADALAWIVEDRNLNQALDAALRFAPNLTVLPRRATRLALQPDQAAITLDDDTHLTADLVIGADGAHSWVRAQADIGIDYRPYEQRAIVANFACSVAHQGIAHQWFTATEGIVALLPLPGQCVSLVWSAPEVLAAELMEQSADALALRLNALPGQPLWQFQPLPPERPQAIPLALIRAHQITATRMALVGDAAHAIHPLAGHGMNLGFADVAALLSILSDPAVGRDAGVDRFLQRYGRARKEQILLMQVATDGLERLFAAQFEPVRIARNIGLNLLDKLPALKRAFISHASGNGL